MILKSFLWCNVPSNCLQNVSYSRMSPLEVGSLGIWTTALNEFIKKLLAQFRNCVTSTIKLSHSASALGLSVSAFIVILVHLFDSNCAWPERLSHSNTLYLQSGNAWFPTSIKALQSDRHRIKLTVLYETLCKDCAQFFQQVIYPKIWALGKDFIDLELIPYGNAIRSNDDGTQVITCQHGSFECTMNKLHSCLLYELKGATVAMPAIMCLFQNEHLTSNITELFNLCAEKESFSKKARDTVFNCFTGYRGITLEEWMALRTESMRPEKHLFVPWIAINDLSYLWYQQYQPILLETLCHMQTNRIKPNSCQTIA
ncbi:GILT-like protein F37H8.5 [Trichinella sp. T9]|nr:GILT-like protein F37H8.5 [Trichinella sp. T9]